MGQMKIILIILYLSSILYSQEYPSWFLNKPNNGNKYYCGQVITEYNKDSSFTTALKNAALRAAINYSTTYELEDVYLSVGGQKSWMDTSKDIVFDTSLVQFYFNSLCVVDSFQTKSFTYVLASETKHKLKGQFVNIKYIPQPAWVENIPRSNNYRYSVGISESYYYVTDSWENSEENARIELAKESKIKSRQVQKKLDSQYSDIVNEITEAKISNVEIISRWMDTNTKLHYTLVRIPI